MAQAPPAPRRFALDHNIPAPALVPFGTMMPFVKLTPVAEIDPAFAELDDWELFVALHRHERRWDGLVTCDAALLKLPKEMTVLSQTALTLVVAEGQGHNPVRAVGVLLCHLRHICWQNQASRPQVWRLGVKQKAHEVPRVYLEEIAERRKTTVQALVEEHRIDPAELRRLDGT